MARLQIRQLDILAKILAEENITISVSNTAKTASFNLKKRILQIPNWDIHQTLQDMFAVHEVGHAKHTPARKWENAITSKPKEEQNAFGSILNIVEDPRIDEKMQKEYPGVRKWYYAGVKELMSMDFFGLKDKKFEELPLLDRLNIYFKTKISYKFDKIKFSDIERYFQDKIANTNTFDDVIAVSEELFKYCKENNEFSKQNGEDGEGEGDSSSGGFNFIFDENDEIDVKEGDNKSGKKPNTIVIKPGKKGDKESENGQKLKGLLPASTMQQLKTFLEKHISKTNVQELFIDEFNTKDFVNQYQFKNNFMGVGATTFFNENKKLINYCVSEFERKKKAADFSRIQENDTGVIDPNKLFKYKVDDNIFLSNTIVREHKNHGFVFLLDLSGPMADTIGQVFKQLLILTYFCKRINVPFEVYGFTSNQCRKNVNGKKLNMSYHGLNNTVITKFVDNKSKPNDMIKLYNELFEYSRYNSMGSTPLTSTLIGMRNVLDEFKNKNKVDILNFILLSDGGCDNGNIAEGGVIIDKKTNIRLNVGQNYANKYDSYINPLFEIIKSRTDANITVYYLMNALNDMYIDYDFAKADVSGFDSKGFVMLPNKFGADQVFYVNSNKIFSDNKEEKNEYFLMKNFITRLS